MVSYVRVIVQRLFPFFLELSGDCEYNGANEDRRVLEIVVEDHGFLISLARTYAWPRFTAIATRPV